MGEESPSTPQNFVEWFRHRLARSDQVDHPEVRYHEPGTFRRVARFLLPGRLSRFHLYEAQDRYLYLRRLLDYHATPFPKPRKSQDNERVIAIEKCRKILDKASVLLTRRQDDLNYLWREMAHVHMMLLEKILPEEFLPGHLDFFREEARRVASTDDADATEMIQKLAEVTQEQNPTKQDKDRMIRASRALIERFTTIRTGRIHQQFVNIRTYRYALLMLAPIALLIMANKDVMLRLPDQRGSERQASAKQPIQPVNMVLTKASAQTVTGGRPETGTSKLVLVQKFFERLTRTASGWLNNNILVFVFFGGLTGGFFSVVNRVRDRKLVPGEDAYSLWYVLTKPFIGALGAITLYILFQAGFVSLELLDGLGNQAGAKAFGFAFLAGFSERIAFPKLR